VPSPHDAADALAVAICHVHSGLAIRRSTVAQGVQSKTTLKSWRHYRPA
jgi:Holliday junction resolvasome RuvABC endonuclease subunit